MRTSIISVSRRERAAAGVALAAGAAIVAVVVTGAGSAGPAKAGGAGGGGGISGSAVVQRRDLVQTDTETGTLSYAGSRTVYNRLSGTITWLPNVGQVIKQGQALFRVDGHPVILMDGTTPAYRDLGPSDAAGADIKQLNRDLIALGFTGYGIVVDDEWQVATTAAVEAFQRSIGETETGTLTLGQIVFMPGEQLVSTVDATLGSTGGSSGGSGSGTGASADAGAVRPEFVDVTTSTPTTTPTTTPAATTPSTTTPATSTPTTTTPPGQGTKPPSKKHPGGGSGRTLAALLALLRAETAQLARERAQSGSPGSGSPNNPGGSKSPGGSGNRGSGNGGNGGSGASGGSGGVGNGGSGGGGNGGSGGGASASAVLETTSTNLVVTVDLDATKQSEAVNGERVTVELPDGTTARGRITHVSPVANVSSSSDSGSGDSSGGSSGTPSATIPVTITLAGRRQPRGLDHASVSVDFQQQKAKHVLSVPVTALVATAGGGYAVQLAAAPHHVIPVRVGLFAAGYVQISGRGIHAGLQVTDSQG